jgi:hypothetical protein
MEVAGKKSNLSILMGPIGFLRLNDFRIPQMDMLSKRSI